MVSISGTSTAATGGTLLFYLNGLPVARQGAGWNSSIATSATVTYIVPNGNSYMATYANTAGEKVLSLFGWYELR